MLLLGLPQSFVLIDRLLNNLNDAAPPQAEAQNLTIKGQKKLSENIMSILQHYKQEDPVGLPGAPIPDPMDIPAFSHSFSVGRMHFKNVKMYGLKKFKIDHIIVDVNAMKVEAELVIDKLNVKGNYTLSTWLSRSAGPFTVDLTNVDIKAIARLEVTRNGTLEAQEIDMDIHFKDIAMDFQNLGFFANMFQGMMNSVGTFVFDSIKPFVLAEANTNIRKDVNKEVHKIPKTFPNSITPLDDVMHEIRKKVRGMGMDPYKIPDYNNSVGVFDVFLTHTWLYGLASFHRTKDIKFEFRNRTIHALLEVGTGTIKGTSNWEISLVAGIVTRAGSVSFSVDYIRSQINISQSLAEDIPPSLDDIQVVLGNIQIRFDGLGTIDYAIEFGVNVLPNLLRYQIMDALEKPIKMKIQEALDQVNMNKIIQENAEKLDNMKIEELQNL
nr:unnamed protein product [Callosobruchus analis]